MIAASFGIEADRMLRLRGRLDRLRKLGCPTGVNTGKGRAAQYGWSQFIELGVAVSMLDIGLGPDTVAKFMERNALHVRLAIVELAQRGGSELQKAVAGRKWPIETTLFLHGTSFSIAGIKRNAEAEAGSAAFVSFDELRAELATAEHTISAMFIVDLGNKLATWITLIASWSSRSVEDVIAEVRRWAESELEALLEVVDALDT